jgi:hypothetical protein
VSRGREWGEELSALYAQEHGVAAPGADAGRVILDADDIARGAKATRLHVLVGPRFRRAAKAVEESFDRLRQTLERAGSSVPRFLEQVSALAKEEATDRASSVDIPKASADRKSQEG